MNGFEIEKETGKFKSWIKVPPYIVKPRISIEDSNNGFWDYELEKLTLQQLEEIAVNAKGVPMQSPLSMRLEGEEWWQLPYEPIITINGKNIITKKQVAKGKVRGSIKERWSQDDYQISINGIFINPEGTGYPDEDVRELRRLCEAAKVQVMCPLFEIFSIDQIVIEDFNFPFTSGPNNQAYSITASSDEIYKLLLRKEDLKVQ